MSRTIDRLTALTLTYARGRLGIVDRLLEAEADSVRGSAR